jgi:hypothetical protein
MVGVLIVEPATRERALRVLQTRSRPQQFEIAERVEWDEPELHAQLLRSRAGQHVARLRRALSAVRTRWSGCELSDLTRNAREQVAESGLLPEYAPALAAFLVENPVLHLDRYGCDAAEFGAKLRSWRESQDAEVQAWLQRTPVGASAARP